MKNKKERVYAILINLDTEALGQYYDNPQADINNILSSYGFTCEKNNLYLGSQETNAVTCVLAIQHLTKKLPQLSIFLKNIQMLRIEEINDLMPVVYKNKL